MRVSVQQEQNFLLTTDRALGRYDNAFIFTNQSEVDFGITLVHSYGLSLNRVSLLQYVMGYFKRL